MTRQRGVLLLEQVLSVGLLALVLLMAALGTIQSGRGSRTAQRSSEAQAIAQSLLETCDARSVSLLPVETLPTVAGTLSDGTPYAAALEVYLLAGNADASGLDDDDIKGLRVCVAWNDSEGRHEARCESLLFRMPR